MHSADRITCTPPDAAGTLVIEASLFANLVSSNDPYAPFEITIYRQYAATVSDGSAQVEFTSYGSTETNSIAFETDGGPRPNPGTSACDYQWADAGIPLCELCSDDEWHCHSFIYYPCPPGFSVSGSCTVGGYCLTCNPTGTGQIFSCGQDGHWATSSSVFCTP
jgi:hypothetical protein